MKIEIEVSDVKILINAVSNTLSDLIDRIDDPWDDSEYYTSLKERYHAFESLYDALWFAQYRKGE